MTWLLINLRTGSPLAEFRWIGPARAALRRAHAAGGWTRISRAWSGGVEMEWCRDVSTGSYRYGPCAIVDVETWNQVYRETQSVAL